MGLGHRLAHPAPAFTVGLASYIAVLEGLYFFTGRRDLVSHLRLLDSDFRRVVWHGCGVPASSCHSSSAPTGPASPTPTANVISPMMAYEGLMAFFLEASFLGVLLFGRRLVPRWAHFVAACMVAFGTLLSSFWILATNSWMQTPAGLHDERWSLLRQRLVGNHLQPVPSLPPRAQRFRRSTSPQPSSCWALVPGWCGAEARAKARRW